MRHVLIRILPTRFVGTRAMSRAEGRRDSNKARQPLTSERRETHETKVLNMLLDFAPYVKKPSMIVNKKTAAAFLGVSTRQLENYARQGRISVRKERGRTGDISVYDEEELHELKKELDAQRGVIQAAVG